MSRFIFEYIFHRVLMVQKRNLVWWQYFITRKERLFYIKMLDCFNLLEHAVGGYSGQRRLNKANSLEAHWYNFKARGAWNMPNFKARGSWNMPKRSSNLAQGNQTEKERTGERRSARQKQKTATFSFLPCWWGEGRGGGGMVVCSAKPICHV